MAAERIREKFNELFHDIPDLEGSELVKHVAGNFKIFLNNIEKEDVDIVQEALADWDHGSDVYHELGKLARQYHEKMVMIEKTLPVTFSKMVGFEIEGTAEKLEYIIELTETSANKTLDLTEKIQEKTDANIASLQKVLADLRSVKEDSNISEKNTTLLQKSIESLEAQIHQFDSMQIDLNDILITQTYQDLTGQVIQKVLNLVNSLEHDLVALIAQFGKSNSVEIPDFKLSGPLKDTHSDKNDQRDVDALLSEYGF